ncbi:MAG: ribonuclease HI family protein [Chloroflexi bacterium]|nr:ribonuclease HI family protein [Chloroflexota bacterium]
MTGRYLLFADGAARGNPGPAGSGAALVDPDGKVVAEVMEYLGRATNNVAEYTALIIGLEEAKRRGIDAIDVRMDSKLVVEQVLGRWKVRHAGLEPLAARAIALLRSFPAIEVRHIPREENTIADLLSNRAIDERAGWSA